MSTNMDKKKEKLKKVQLLKQKLEAKKKSDPKAEKLLNKLSQLTAKNKNEKRKEEQILRRDPSKTRRKNDKINKADKTQESIHHHQKEKTSQSQPSTKVSSTPALLFPIDTISKFDLFLSVRYEIDSEEYEQKVLQLIRRAAEHRVKEVKLIAKCKKTKTLRIGLVVDNEHLLVPITLGPSGDAPEAEEFRKFWGDKAELRRFEDGSIKESIFWDAKNLAQARSILLRSLNHVFESHLALTLKDGYSYENTRLQNVLLQSVKPFTIGTGEQYRQKILNAKDELDKLLRGLSLRLNIKDIRSSSAVLRGTEVCYEPPVLSHLSFEHSKKDQYLLSPIELILHLEQSSSHWPVKVRPLRSLKTAFYLDIFDKLKEKKLDGLSAKFHTDFLDVLFQGYVFRLRLYVAKEISLLQNSTTHKGQVNKANLREAILMEKQLVLLPEISSHLFNLNQQSLNYGTAVRLAKVWISSNYLSDYLNDIAIELILAKIYLDDPNIYYLRGFVLFLQTLFTYDWYHKPMLVNLNGEFTDDQLTKIENSFTQDRSNFPLISICTPFDTSISMWTRQPQCPILPVVLGRIVHLARNSYLHLAQCISSLTNDYLQVFLSPTDIFDAVIHLNHDFVPNFHYNIHRNQHPTEIHRHCILYHIMCSKCAQAQKRPKEAAFPLVQRNHVQAILQLLREHYGQWALFFYDQFGGDQVGILWKPEARQPVPFDAQKMRVHRICELADEEGHTQMQPDIDEILEDIELIGGQIVKKITIKNVKRDKSVVFPSSA